MRPDKVVSMLGLAMKAGKIASGEFQTENAVKSGTGCLVIIAEDASDNTKKKFRNMCSFYEVPCVVYADREELGRCIGKEFRATLAVLDEGFAASIEKQLSDQISKERR